MKGIKKLGIAACCLFLVGSYARNIQAKNLEDSLVSKSEIVSELEEGIVDNTLRDEAVIKLFMEANGECKVNVLQIPETSQYNISVEIEGKTDRTIVIGAHSDFVPPGQGIIDNFSGVTLLTNIYETILSSGYKPRHNLIFMTFANEETMQHGSESFINSLNEEKKSKIRYMINLDCFGIGNLNYLGNDVDLKLEELIKKFPEKINRVSLFNVVADSFPFIREGIPAVTIHAIDNWFVLKRYPNSENDTIDNVNFDKLYKQYRTLVEFVYYMDQQ